MVVPLVGDGGEADVIRLIVPNLPVLITLFFVDADSLLHAVENALGHLESDALPQLVLLHMVVTRGIIDAVEELFVAVKLKVSLLVGQFMLIGSLLGVVLVDGSEAPPPVLLLPLLLLLVTPLVLEGKGVPHWDLPLFRN